MVAGSQPVTLVLLSVPAGWPSVPGCFSLFDAVPCPPRRPSPNWGLARQRLWVGPSCARRIVAGCFEPEPGKLSSYGSRRPAKMRRALWHGVCDPQYGRQ